MDSFSAATDQGPGHRFNAIFNLAKAPTFNWSLGTAPRAHIDASITAANSMTHDAAQSPCPSVEADGQPWITNQYDESLLILIDTS